MEVKDDSSVSDVFTDYWYGSGATDNISMVQSGDVWSLEITVGDTLTPLGYRYHAIDASGHWNQTEVKLVQIVDNDLPVLVMDEAPSEAKTGDPFMFMVEVGDNIEATTVSVEYWFGDSSPDNVTMDKWSEDFWWVEVNIPENDLASMHYYYWIPRINRGRRGRWA